MTRIKLRCAIYTRKSTNDGLEQDFNSLDAQREACAAYIKSQAHEGWTLVDALYDDGAYSGATLARPAMDKLMAAIKAGQVDVIVVYKVDRLTRSLMDFAKLVELFDQHQVSFVSVTQQFNTTSSIGRLTLNVLLSFAQFEREVTAERIRDKIAASRKKGIWMGGTVPLGYRLHEKKLVANESEARAVRLIFKLYLEMGGIRPLMMTLKERGIKPRPHKYYGMSGGFSRGQLSYLLNNPVYIGKARHKDKIYPGEHEAILSEDLFDQVQAKLKAHAPFDTKRYRSRKSFLLRGLVCDEVGHVLTTSHANKKGKRYHYYITRPIDGEKQRPPKVWRLPARELEALVIAALDGLLKDPKGLMDLINLQDASAHDWQRIAAAAHTTEKDLRAIIVPKCMVKIKLFQDQIDIALNPQAMGDALRLETKINAGTIKVLSVPVQNRRRGVETKIVMSGNQEGPQDDDTRVIELVVKAINWFELLKTGKAVSISEIAAQEKVHASDISRYLTLAFLAPDIIEDMLAGRLPLPLTANRLKHLTPIPSNWEAQATHLDTGDTF